MNIGKVFELEFKNSVPKECWYYRFRDGTSAFGKSDKVRFQATNICDCLVMSKELYLVELKSTYSTSLPFSNIKSSQIEGLTQVEKDNIKPIFIICFRKHERCFSISAKKLYQYMNSTDRKSVPVDFLEKNGLEIPMIKSKTRFRYDLKELFEV